MLLYSIILNSREARSRPPTSGSLDVGCRSPEGQRRHPSASWKCLAHKLCWTRRRRRHSHRSGCAVVARATKRRHSRAGRARALQIESSVGQFPAEPRRAQLCKLHQGRPLERPVAHALPLPLDPRLDRKFVSSTYSLLAPATSRRSYCSPLPACLASLSD